MGFKFSLGYVFFIKEWVLFYLLLLFFNVKKKRFNGVRVRKEGSVSGFIVGFVIAFGFFRVSFLELFFFDVVVG